jgi:hypothetical protein
MTNLQWRRPIAETLATGTHRRRWLSRCGSYCVERHQHDGLPTVYLAVMLPNRLLSRHRTKTGAMDACEVRDRRGAEMACR